VKVYDDYELGWMFQDAIMDYLPGGNEKNYDILQSGQPTSQQKFERGTSQMRRSLTTKEVVVMMTHCTDRESNVCPYGKRSIKK
jgi:hypothetical protein